MSTVIKVKPSDILSVIPGILGFHPADSVVVAAIDHRGRIAPAARIDLPHSPAEVTQAAEAVTTVLAKHASRCVVIFYGDDTYADEFRRHLERDGLSVVDVLQAGNEAQEVNGEMAAESALHGRVIAASRDEMRAWVEYQHNGLAPDPAILESMLTLKDRDRYLASAVVNAEQALPDLLTCCQRTPDHGASDGSPGSSTTTVAANLLSVTAVVAYRSGNGALAQIALDRALRIEPDHRLSHLMLSLMAAGLPPAELDDLAKLPV